jgi:hypothetical protein
VVGKQKHTGPKAEPSLSSTGRIGVKKQQHIGIPLEKCSEGLPAAQLLFFFKGVRPEQSLMEVRSVEHGTVQVADLH